MFTFYLSISGRHNKKEKEIVIQLFLEKKNIFRVVIENLELHKNEKWHQYGASSIFIDHTTIKINLG